LVPTQLHDAANAEKLIRRDLPAAVDEFLARLPDGFRARRRRRWVRRVALFAVLAGLGAFVAAVVRVPSLGPEPRRDDEA
jgi:fatty acid desaturase